MSLNCKVSKALSSSETSIHQSIVLKTVWVNQSSITVQSIFWSKKHLFASLEVHMENVEASAQSSVIRIVYQYCQFFDPKNIYPLH